jgi:hypothetical protein
MGFFPYIKLAFTPFFGLDAIGRIWEENRRGNLSTLAGKSYQPLFWHAAPPLTSGQLTAGSLIMG